MNSPLQPPTLPRPDRRPAVGGIPTPPRRYQTAQAKEVPCSGEPLHMLVDELYRKNVCYIAAEYRENDSKDYTIVPVGTAFFVRYVLGSHAFYYAITARHVIQDTHDSSQYRNIFFRVNNPGSRVARDIPVSYEDWVFHADSDVAVCRANWDASIDVFGLPVGALGTPATPGHDVFFIGLFERLPGEGSVDAIVRFGKVAHPLTKVPISDFSTGRGTKIVDAYLVESRSWGGESGSPVFLHDEHYVVAPEPGLYGWRADIQQSRVTSTQVEPKVLGLLYGHFEINRSVRSGTVETGDEVDLNSGIAVVIPASKILETLADPRLENYRQEAIDRAVREQQTPKPDAAV